MIVAVGVNGNLFVRPEADDSCFYCDCKNYCPLIKALESEAVIPHASSIRIRNCAISAIVKTTQNTTPSNN